MLVLAACALALLALAACVAALGLCLDAAVQRRWHADDAGLPTVAQLPAPRAATDGAPTPTPAP